METITVRFYTLWKLYLGTDSLSLQAHDMEEVVAQIEERFGDQLREQLRAHGIQSDLPMLDYSLLLLNGRNVDKQNLGQIEVKAGDILHILPLAMGG